MVCTCRAVARSSRHCCSAAAQLCPRWFTAIVLFQTLALSLSAPTQTSSECVAIPALLPSSDGACDSAAPAFPRSKCSSPRQTCSPRHVPSPRPRGSYQLTPFALQFESKSSRAKGIAFHPKRSVPVFSSMCRDPRVLTSKQSVDPRLPALVDHSAMGLSHGNPYRSLRRTRWPCSRR